MKKWRFLSLVGIILGIGLEIIDYFIMNIPYMLLTPLQIVAIAMIFGGFICRKYERTHKKDSRAEKATIGMQTEVGIET